MPWREVKDAFTRWRAAYICLCLLVLSSCVSPVPQPALPASALTTPQPTNAATRYRLSAEQSQLHILVYREGALAYLGHNHVLSSASLSGSVWLHDSLAQSGFAITLPVNDLIIDDPQARAAEGVDFAKTVNDDARMGTKRNLLKPELLDGEHYPHIQLRAVRITGTREQAVVTVQITIKAQTREVTLPVQLSLTAQGLLAKGEFDIRQSDFGITPFSVMMGALQVQDRVTIKFELAAVRSD